MSAPGLDSAPEPRDGQGGALGERVRPRVLYVEGSSSVLDLGERIDASWELERESSPTRALAGLDAEGDFAVVVCDENINGTPGLELLVAVRSLSPTSARVLISESLARGVTPRSVEIVFRCLSPHAAPSEWRRAMSEALAYHQLLSPSPAQPVESARADRVALPPPPDPRPRAPRSPAPAADGAPWPLSPWPGADVPAPELIVLEPNARRVGLEVVGRFVELLPGLTIVGRSRTCHIPIPDAQISRRHATFSNDGREVHVRNISQTNGVRVNGVLIERDAARLLAVGDRVMLGSHEVELCALGDYSPSFEPTQTTSLFAATPDPRSRSSTLITLARVAEKYFVLGQSREAERILRPVLEGLLRHSRIGREPARGDVELATDVVLRIAEANHAGEWINFIFELFTLLERPLEAEQVERLCRVAPESRGVKMSAYRSYLDVLAKVVDRLGPRERFLVRRIQGLEKRLVMSAHL